MPSESSALVLDTNIVLDLFVFADAATAGLHEGLQQGRLRWLASSAMREELLRVLDYPQIVKSLNHHGKTKEEVLARFDSLVTVLDVAPKASVTCKDPDDQKFIDLAVAHGALLLSKDNAVLCMHKRLLGFGSGARVSLT